MPLFLIRRGFGGASETDLDAAAFRALACAPYYPGMRWERSYWDPAAELTYCLYQAGSEETIRLHAERAQIPCDDVREVQEVLPATFGAPARPAPGDGPDILSPEPAPPTLFAIRRPFPGATANDLDAAAIRALFCLQDGVHWQRSFWDPTAEETLCVYEARAAADLREHSRRSRLPVTEVCAVEEILPERFENA